jgi:predicted secreted hydrolase
MSVWLRNRSRLVSTCLFLIVVLSSCAFPGLTTTIATLPQVSHTDTQPALPAIRFPQDEGAHHNLTEWWYYTGHMQATDATGKQHTYGFELVIFQVSRSDLPLVYPAHFAITDVTRGQFHYDQRIVTQYNGKIPDGQSTQGIDEHVGDWSIQGLNGKDHLIASMNDYAMNVNLNSLKAPSLHNGNGLITYGLGGYSYYYSRTRMQLGGTLVDHNQTLKVTGTVWMDHQWGNFLTLGGSGWDWYSLQLNNNTEIMLYFIRGASGKVISAYADYIGADAKSIVFSANTLHTTVLSQWTSPATGIIYPSGWRLQIDDPHLKTTLTIKPLLKNQELNTQNSTGNIYWEGAVSIDGSGNGRPLTGQGYVELTGYKR